MGKNTNKGLIVDGDDLSASFNSDPINLENSVAASMHIFLDNNAGTAVGTITIGITNFTPDQNRWVNAEWIQGGVATSSLAVSSATDLDVIVSFELIAVRFMRFQWTRTSGTATDCDVMVVRAYGR